MFNFSEKQFRLLTMSGIFFLIALVLSAYAFLCPSLTSAFEPTSLLNKLFLLASCSEIQKEGLYMASCILCVMGGYCLASGLRNDY